MKTLLLPLLLLLSCLPATAQKAEGAPIPTPVAPLSLQPEALCCVTVSTPFDTGAFVFIISLTITGPCDEIEKNGAALAWELLMELCGHYKAYN